jgi:hypothetical protein
MVILGVEPHRDPWPYFCSHSQSHITTDDQSVSASWFRAPSGAHDQMLITNRPGYTAGERTTKKTPLRFPYCWTTSLPERTTKKTLVASIVAPAIVACVCVAKQRLRLRPQRARYNIYRKVLQWWDSSEIMQFRVTIATNGHGLTGCMNICSKSRINKQSSAPVYHIYSVRTDNFLMWICGVVF